MRLSSLTQIFQEQGGFTTFRIFILYKSFNFNVFIQCKYVTCSLMHLLLLLLVGVSVGSIAVCLFFIVVSLTVYIIHTRQAYMFGNKFYQYLYSIIHHNHKETTPKDCSNCARKYNYEQERKLLQRNLSQQSYRGD